MKRFLFIAVLILAGCQATYNAPAVTQAQEQLIANPSTDIKDKVAAVLPDFLAEDRVIEQAVFKMGRPLDERETQIARLVGVSHPEKVRIAVVRNIPLKGRAEAIQRYAGLASLDVTIKALAAGYGIVFAKGNETDIEILAHELVHVRQFEEYGREGLARKVLTERAVLSGITVIPTEQEAIFDTARVLGVEPAYYPY